MDINKDCHAFHLAFRVPDEESSRLDVFFEAHERFMRETHFTEGETEPRVLVYNITKCPELKNPLNPDEGTTGYTLFGLHEVYRGPEGCAAHMAAGQAREALFAEFLDLVQTYMVSGLLAAPVIRTM